MEGVLPEAGEIDEAKIDDPGAHYPWPSSERPSPSRSFPFEISWNKCRAGEPQCPAG
jgi:hypothetical protein